MSSTPPDLMTADERLDEVARILVAGLRRLRDREKDRNPPADSPSDERESQENQVFNLRPAQRVSSTATGHQRVHGSRPNRRGRPQ